MNAAFTVQLSEEGRFVPTVVPGHRAEAEIVDVAYAGQNAYRDFSILAFGGENEVSLYSTSMQDGSTDIVMLHAQCDNPLRVFHTRFYRADRAQCGAAVVGDMLAQINQQIADWLN